MARSTNQLTDGLTDVGVRDACTHLKKLLFADVYLWHTSEENISWQFNIVGMVGWAKEIESTLMIFIYKHWNIPAPGNPHDTDEKLVSFRLLNFLDPWVDGPRKWSPADLSGA